MPTRPPQHRASGWRPAPVERREQKRAHDRRRGREQPWRALYKDARWIAARLRQFALQPLCERCLRDSRVTPATVVNHRIRHRGDEVLFFDPSNHESVCKRCHDGEVQREERAADRADGSVPQLRRG